MGGVAVGGSGFRVFSFGGLGVQGSWTYGFRFVRAWGVEKVWDLGFGGAGGCEERLGRHPTTIVQCI